MAAGKWKLYEAAKAKIANSTIDLDGDTFVMNLYASNSNANTLASATIATLANITNQLSTANGYTQDNKSITLSVTQSGGTVTVDSTDPQWTASGGSITARYAVVADTSIVPRMPICVCVLDTTPADVTATDGNTFTITINASGLFTISGATSD